MIEFTNYEAYGFHHAIRGMRNSWGSHKKSDSHLYYDEDTNEPTFYLGDNDHALAMKLAKAGSSHRKYLRQVEVWVDINAPLYWWKELDQYKIGLVTNSESTMHTIQKHPMDEELFSIEPPEGMLDEAQFLLEHLEHVRQMYNTTKDKKYWRYLIQILPSGWMQKRTTSLNYEVIANAYWDRKNHRLTEWHDFCDWVKLLPYSEIITGEKLK